MGENREYDAIAIGGGFFGCRIALSLREIFPRVLLVERAPDLLQRASWVNQARVHRGYHYPRSILTALRSRVNFSYFASEYADCIECDFEKYYAIARYFSKANLKQFKTFCARIGAPLHPASSKAAADFNPTLVEGVLTAIEYVFDADKLRERVREQLHERGIDVCLQTEARSLEPSATGGVAVEVRGGDGGVETLKAGLVFNCTYSALNRILAASGLDIIPLKHEFTEMALVEVPPALRNKGITVMCGPFFSLMPFPPRQLHTLSHVRYTPHCHWYDRPQEPLRTVRLPAAGHCPYRSRFPHIIRDASRYLPALRESRYVGSLWEIKTVLPRSEIDDSRPILFQRDRNLPGAISVLGGKIDNVYDLPQELKSITAGGPSVGKA